MEHVKLAVGGMSCGHCVKAVQQAITSIEGAEAESVTIGSVSVAYDPARTSVGALIDAVADAGYEAQETS